MSLLSRFKSALRSGLLGADERLSRLYLATAGDPPGLISFLFHAVRPEPAPAGMDEVVDPTQILSVHALDRFVEHFRGKGYRFVSPREVLDGLPEDGRFLLMTFDDGYRNNVNVLPVLARHGVPATFFISTGHVARGIAYWWDVVFRERARRGSTAEAIRREQNELKRRTNAQIEAYLVETFGAGALDVIGDDDRPLSETELGELASAPGVHLGNHTHDHAILTNYAPDEAEAQIRRGQDELVRMTGRRPEMISYPNGNFSEPVVEMAMRSGLALGVTVDPGRNRIPLDGALTIKRFCFTQGQEGEHTYLSFRSPVSVRGLKRRLTTRPGAGGGATR